MKPKKVAIYFTDLFFLSSLDWFLPIIYNLKNFQFIFIIENQKFFEKFKKNIFYEILNENCNIYFKVINVNNKNKDFFYIFKKLQIYKLLRYIYYKFFFIKLSNNKESINKKNKIKEYIKNNQFDLCIFQYANFFTNFKKEINSKIILIPHSVEIKSKENVFSTCPKISDNDYDLILENTYYCEKSWKNVHGDKVRVKSIGLPRADINWINDIVFKKYEKKLKNISKKSEIAVFFTRKTHPTSPYFENLNLNKEIIEALKLHNFFVIIKPHPNEDTSIYNQYKHDKNIMISDLPSSLLIKHMSLAIFTKSAIGLEIALNRKSSIQILSNKDKENIYSDIEKAIDQAPKSDE